MQEASSHLQYASKQQNYSYCFYYLPFVDTICVSTGVSIVFFNVDLDGSFSCVAIGDR